MPNEPGFLMLLHMFWTKNFFMDGADTYDIVRRWFPKETYLPACILDIYYLCLYNFSRRLERFSSCSSLSLVSKVVENNGEY